MIFFISDLHLCPQRPAITQAFYGFLQTTAKSAQALYILGDFFEVWLGDDDDTPLYQEVIKHLKAYSEHTRIYIMHGNRDFLLGNDFAVASGATLLNDPSVVSHYGQHYLLMHGDSLCTRDQDYMAFRQMCRSEQWQAQLLATSLSDRRAYAEKVRATSQSMNSLKAEDIMDVTPSEVHSIMAEHQVTTLIHGHTHRPDIHPVPNPTTSNTPAYRFVLGDWGEKGWYIHLGEAGNPELKSFTIS